MPKYKIVSSDQRERFGPDAKPRQVYVVWIETENGTTGSIEVPKNQWNKEDLPGILEAFADELDLAFSLQI